MDPEACVRCALAVSCASPASFVRIDVPIVDAAASDSAAAVAAKAANAAAAAAAEAVLTAGGEPHAAAAAAQAAETAAAEATEQQQPAVQLEFTHACEGISSCCSRCCTLSRSLKGTCNCNTTSRSTSYCCSCSGTDSLSGSRCSSSSSSCRRSYPVFMGFGICGVAGAELRKHLRVRIPFFGLGCQPVNSHLKHLGSTV